MTADQPLSENRTARSRAGGGITFIRCSNTCLESFKTLSLNSEGMLRGTDNFYFTLMPFSFKLELVLINRVIDVFLTGVPICLFSYHVWYKIRCIVLPEPFIYAPLHGMNTVLAIFALSYFCCSLECVQNH